MKIKTEEYITQDIKIEEFTLIASINIKDYLLKEIRIEDSRTDA